MTKPGIYQHYKGGLYRVLFTARQSTNGPNEGTIEVVYLHLGSNSMGMLCTRDEAQFNELVEAPSERGFNPGVKIPRFSFVSSGLEMSDADAVALYDDLLSTFTGRTPK